MVSGTDSPFTWPNLTDPESMAISLDPEVVSVAIKNLLAEWRELSPYCLPNPDLAPGQRVHFLNTIDSLREIYEFAARLTMSLAGDAEMFVETLMVSLHDRRLSTLSIYNPDGRIFTTDQSTWERQWSGPRTELISRPRDLAAIAARDFFSSFGLDLSVETIQSIQDRIGH